MRVRHAFRTLLLLASALGLQAQVEPELKTATDLSDVYKAAGSKSSFVAIYDMTPVSRGVFESAFYLSQRSHDSYLYSGAPQQPEATINANLAIFKPGTAQSGGGVSNLGYIFAGRKNVGKNLNPMSTDVDVRMYLWPNGPTAKSALKTVGGVDIVGAPMYTDAAGFLQPAYWNTDIATTLQTPLNNAGAVQNTRVTHVRFAIKLSTGVVRTIDLPCPWMIVDSPTTAPNKITQFQPNYQHPTVDFGGNTITFDTYSGTAATITYTNATYLAKLADGDNPNTASGAGAGVIGQFYYSPDYLAWIFGGHTIRSQDSSQWLTLPWNGSGGPLPYATDAAGQKLGTYPVYSGNFVVPDAITDAKPGWANGLPVMTRYQATKVASINVFLDKMDGVNWDYRYLAPWVPGGPQVEEGNGATYNISNTTHPTLAGATTAAGSTTDLRTIRPLSFNNGTYGLTVSGSSLQKIGPDDITWAMSGTLKAYDNGSFINIDPITSEPLSSALGNTYRDLFFIRKDGGDLAELIFGDQNADCPGQVYVCPFLTNGPNDSLSVALDQKSAISNGANYYVKYYHGNTGNNAGSYAYAAGVPSMTPGAQEFHPGVLSSVAAHANGGAIQSGNWSAPWSSDPAKPFSVRTAVISLAIPGPLGFKSTNNGLDPHEQLFAVAQWGAPKITSWSKANPANLDKSVTQGGTVWYFPSNDPKALEDNLKSLLGFIVSAGAALSAPATPATGVRNADEAYFGTFVTNPQHNFTVSPTVWSGNLYSIGLDRSTGLFKFYGNQSGGSYPIIKFIDSSSTNAFDLDNLWSAYKIFSDYQNKTSLFLANYQADNANTGVLGSPMSWKNRRIFIANAAGSLERFVYNYAVPPQAGGGVALANTTQLDKILADVNSGTQVVGGPIVARIATGSAATDRIEVLNFMRWVMGAFDPTQQIPNNTASTSNIAGVSNGYFGDYNRDNNDVTVGSGSPSLGNASHVNLMGDVIDSSPLTVELAKDIAGNVTYPTGPSSSVQLSADPWFSFAYSNAATEPHTRLILVGTNTGMLHCFVEVACKPKDLSGKAGPVRAKATELWGFVPPTLMPLLYDLYLDYNAHKTTDDTPHRYALDGDPILYFNDQPNPGSVVGDTRVGRIAGEEAVVVFGMRKGARDYFGIQIADGATGAITPDKPKLVFRVDALGGRVVRGDGTVFSDAALKHLGMGTAIPTFAAVQAPDGKKKNVVFISGGYSNAQVDANYQKKYNDPNFKVGRLILALDPLTGYNSVSGGTLGWNFSDASTYNTMGAIPGGVTAIGVTELTTGYAQRLYFADTRGNIWAINSDKFAPNSSFRLDSADILTWTTAPRLVYSNLDKERFTNAPDAFRLPGDYPVLQDDGQGAMVRPVTVMVSVGSGDRNNPIDAEETFTNPTTNTDQQVLPVKTDRLYVVADLQNRQTPLDENNLKKVDSSWADGMSCFETPLQEELTPGNANYLWKNYYGYYYQTSDSTGTHPFAYNNVTYDKVMVSPLIKEKGLFYSFFSVQGSSGFNCSAFAQTRTYRLCDIMKPLYFDPRIALTSGINKDNLTPANDSCAINPENARCSGLAFSFNSLSSQLVDAGDYVMQGGAKSTAQAGGNSYSENTPDIQSVRNVGKGRGFRIRSWRVVR